MFSKLRGHDTAVQDIHGILHLDYKVPRKRFLNNACIQAVDHHPRIHSTSKRPHLRKENENNHWFYIEKSSAQFMPFSAFVYT
ncbi:hypothetical protein ACN38_g5902 [Penicillium nordicum]|uniref:Uncharacterized protein n=1 Tax=Penicillium nordicum TaxID=229535 RepID=A0A0M8P0T7_9EURO|nr:hypothetical protein ACN38_g5902 [Penicillium nordicum]